MSRAVKAKTLPVESDWATLRPDVTEALLADMTHRIVEAFHPEKVILFGSYAYGTPHLYSDVDLLIVMDSAERMPQRALRISRVAKVDFLPLDVLVYTPEELKHRQELGDFFVKEILERGKVLYQRESPQ